MQINPHMKPDEIVQLLSEITEVHGLKYEYQMKGDTAVALNITATEKPDVNTAIDAIVLAIGIFSAVAHETICQFNREQPLIQRHQASHMLHQLIGEQCSKAMVAAIDNTKSEIEIVH